MRLHTYLGLWVPSWVAFDIFVCIDSKSMMVSRNKSCNSLHFVFCIFIMHIVHTGQNRPTIQEGWWSFPTQIHNKYQKGCVNSILNCPVCLPIFRQIRHSAAASRPVSKFKSKNFLENLVKSQSGHAEKPCDSEWNELKFEERNYQRRSWIIPNFFTFVKEFDWLEIYFKTSETNVNLSFILEQKWFSGTILSGWWTIRSVSKSLYLFMTGVANFCQVPRILQVRKTNFIDFFWSVRLYQTDFRMCAKLPKKYFSFPTSIVHNEKKWTSW